jgi:hypothetical protein
LASYSVKVATAYWQSALRACFALRVNPSILLHPLDFIGCDDNRSLAFFPGMNIATDRKIKIVRECLSGLTSQFQVVSIGKFADSIVTLNLLKIVTPKFFH